MYTHPTQATWKTDKSRSGSVGRPGPRVSSLPRPRGARDGLGVKHGLRGRFHPSKNGVGEWDADRVDARIGANSYSEGWRVMDARPGAPTKTTITSTSHRQAASSRAWRQHAAVQPQHAGCAAWRARLPANLLSHGGTSSSASPRSQRRRRRRRRARTEDGRASSRACNSARAPSR